MASALLPHQQQQCAARPSHDGRHGLALHGTTPPPPPWAGQLARGGDAGQVGFSVARLAVPRTDDGRGGRDGAEGGWSESSLGSRPTGVELAGRRESPAAGASSTPRGPNTPAVTHQQLEGDAASVVERRESPQRPKWYRRAPSWSASSLSSRGSTFGSLSSWTSSSVSPRQSTAALPHAPPMALLDPTENLQLYVRRAAVGLFPFATLDPQKSTRDVLERSYEALHPTRLSRPRLERVERIPEKEWARDAQRYVSQVPSAPISLLLDDGPFFRLCAAGFKTETPAFPRLSSTVAGATFWLNKQVLLTALSVLDATRPTRSDFEFCKVTTMLAAERIGDGLYPTSPYPPARSQTLVLLNHTDTADRVVLVVIVEPEQGLMSAFVKPEEDWELGVPFRDRRREMRPAPSTVHANLLQAHIWASARENRISHFVLTDTREFVFGEVGLAPALHRDVEDPLAISTIGRGRVFGVEVGLQGTGDFEAVPQGTEGVMSVKKAIHFTSDSPSVLESLVFFITRAFDITREERATGVNIWTPPPPLPPKPRS